MARERLVIPVIEVGWFVLAFLSPDPTLKMLALGSIPFILAVNSFKERPHTPPMPPRQ